MVKIDTGWLIILGALATFRVTRFVNADTLLDKPRIYLMTHRLRVFYFVTCPWCVSIYVATGVVICTALWPAQWAYIAAVLAFSAVAGFLGDRS